MNSNLPTPLRLAQLPTPMEYLPLPSARLGVRILVKRDDLTGGITSGNKVRKLEYSLSVAKTEGCQVIISCGATQTNHGRALAALCAQLNMKCHLFLLGDESDKDRGNHLLIRILGARIEYIKLDEYANRHELMTRAQEEYAQEKQKSFIIPTGASDGLGSLGYMMAVLEIAEQSQAMGEKIDHIVVAVGSGGTMAGLFAGTTEFQQKWRLHGITVCDNADYFRLESQKIFEDIRSHFLPHLELDANDMEFVDGFKGRGYGRSDGALRKRLVALARECGLVLDPVYTMKAWRGLEALVERQVIRPGETVVFIHTGGTNGLLGHGPHFRMEDLET